MNHPGSWRHPEMPFHTSWKSYLSFGYRFACCASNIKTLFTMSSESMADIGSSHS
jgi:hypothetical protein